MELLSIKRLFNKRHKWFTKGTSFTTKRSDDFYSSYNNKRDLLTLIS